MYSIAGHLGHSTSFVAKAMHTMPSRRNNLLPLLFPRPLSSFIHSFSQYGTDLPYWMLRRRDGSTASDPVASKTRSVGEQFQMRTPDPGAKYVIGSVCSGSSCITTPPSSCSWRSIGGVAARQRSPHTALTRRLCTITLRLSCYYFISRLVNSIIFRQN